MEYKWRTTFSYQNPIDPNNHLSYGVSPSTYDSWQTATIGTPGSSGEITYFYRDSNTMYAGQYVDSLSSRVAFYVTQTWTTSVDNNNNLTVSVTTNISSIQRDDVRGSDQATPGRNITVYKEQGGAAIISVTDNQINTAHQISGAVSLGTYTFTLAPGQSATKNTLYIHNQTVGMSGYDDIWAGVQFMNPLPADYRPGQRKISGTWYSHNRVAGTCNRKVSGVWTEMRTLNGGVGTGNPPSRKSSGTWYNQRKIGAE